MAQAREDCNKEERGAPCRQLPAVLAHAAGWAVSVFLHASLLAAIASLCEAPTPPPQVTEFTATLAEDPERPPEERCPEDEWEEECELDPEKESVEDPVHKPWVIAADHVESDRDEAHCASRGKDMDAVSDTPFKGRSTNTAIGLGAGASGAFSGRFGGAQRIAMPPPAPRVPPPPAPVPIPLPDDEFNTESYDRIDESPFRLVTQDPLSTFSIDVDTASYSNVRRFLCGGALPPPDAVRIEELLNYFPYDYEPPTDGAPFASHIRVAGCPWDLEHRLVRIALKGREIARDHRPRANLVFLIDVSGSMDDPAKLPLVQRSLQFLAERLGENDRVAIVVYAAASGLVLPPTTGDRRREILDSIGRLRAGGSTNGGAGIELAYRLAEENSIEGGTNRVILATDGDFNVGVTDRGSLTRLVEERAKSGVYLSVLGFGMGNYKDSTLEELADRGNGNYAYIDTFAEARKVFGDEMSAALVTIAKDVKIQVEFNPARVAAYRLIGYENRILAHQDFNDDRKDAGEIGAGHTVTALYEIVPAGKDAKVPGVDPLRYQKIEPAEEAASEEILTLKLRYKDPEASESKKLEFAAKDEGLRSGDAGEDFLFAAAAAEFGMLLRRSDHRGSASFEQVLELARSGKGEDPHGYRAEFVELVTLARRLGGPR